MDTGSDKGKEELCLPVYRATTLPLKDSKSNYTVKYLKPKKKRRRDKSDLGENFIAPDGGWAWLVCIAAGISNLSVYPCLVLFGFIFREHLEVLGLTNAQITTIINTNPAISACSGLLNGPMFRRFTFRQVAIMGSLLVFVGIFLTSFCQTFISYVFTYSLLYGFGMGISVSASSLAVNTYFKERRRRAAGLTWSITGLLPIILPHVITYLLATYGVQGTVYIFAALSLHSFACALVYEPVLYHARKPVELPELTTRETITECKYCTLLKQRKTSFFSSQHGDENEYSPGFEITEPGTPMLSRANDGWFGSKVSLSSDRPRLSRLSSCKDSENIALRQREDEELKQENIYKSMNFRKERDRTLSRGNSLKSESLKCTCHDQKGLLEDSKMTEESITIEEPVDKPRMTFLQKLVVFFDLDLLRDFTYINMVAGLTMINFSELNFSVLTPFILIDFGLTTNQITLCMSALGGLDLSTRFLLPFLIEKIAWDNRVFFLIGVIGMATGRTVIAFIHSFPVIITTFAIMGIFKGVRTIFWPLIIPSCVPLKRLPAASGLQLLISGIFTLIAGPFVGLIRDRYNYAITLHCLNVMTFGASLLWTIEGLVRRYFYKPSSLCNENEKL
uniref:Major facilitator superfamily (MFS) profile domain-containing protein n=1 Tax=Glossina brevipalpis TaxID=37001 RepID=A0A1A9W686_9MUSC